MGMRKEMNIWYVVELLEDFKSDVKQLLSMVVSNKNALSDLRKDFKRFLNLMEKMTKEENMKTFRKFVSELEKFNKNAERMSKELEEMKDIMKGFSELAETLKGD